MTTDSKRLARFLFCVSGVWASFFIWGVLQERISTHKYVVDGVPQVFRSPFVIIFMQALFAFLVSVCVWLGPALFSGRTVGGDMKSFSDEKATDEHKSDPKTATQHKPNHHHHHHHHKHPKSLIASLCDWNKFTASTWRSLAFIGFTMTFGAPFGYAAVRAGMPYPIMITVKLGKMIPIVVISTFVYRIRYPVMKYIIAGLITAGVVWFTFAGDSAGGHGSKGHGAKQGQSFSTYAPVIGTILVLINLFMDGFTSSSQDAVVKTTHTHGNPLQLLSNLSCLVWSLVSIVAFEFLPENEYTTAELSAALHFFSQAPDALYELMLMALLNAVGQVFIFQTITHFGSLTLTAITVTRKTGSVFLSIFIHGHSLALDQFCAMGLVLAGVALETYDSIKSKKKHPKKE